MDFDHIQAFMEIVKEKSFSRAAERLYRTQPALSKQVRQLETELGQRLLSRRGKQVEPTPAGVIFLEHCRKIMDTRREALDALQRLKDRPRGRLAVGANEATALYVLPPVFAEFSARYPDVRLTIHRNFTRKLVERVLDNALDFAVVSLPVDDKDLVVLPLHKDELGVVVPAGHPLARQRAGVDLAQVAQYPLIFPRTGRTRGLLERIFADAGVEPRVSLELASVEAIKKFVAGGLGISLIARSFARREVQHGLLRVLPVKGLALVRELGLIHHVDKYLDPVMQAFLKVVQDLRPRLSAEE
jgi:DNA-binding transcriptional LysR family regulator